MSKAEGKKAATHSRSDQDNVTLPLEHNHDNDDAIADNDPEEDWDLGTDADVADGMLPAIEQVSVAHFLNHWTQFFISLIRLSRLSVRTLNIDNPGFMRSILCSLEMAGFQIVIAVHHSCWSLMWEHDGLPHTKCSVRCFHYYS